MNWIIKEHSSISLKTNGLHQQWRRPVWLNALEKASALIWLWVKIILSNYYSQGQVITFMLKLKRAIYIFMLCCVCFVFMLIKSYSLTYQFIYFSFRYCSRHLLGSIPAVNFIGVTVITCFRLVNNVYANDKVGKTDWALALGSVWKYRFLMSAKVHHSKILNPNLIDVVIYCQSIVLLTLTLPTLQFYNFPMKWTLNDS